MFCWVILFCRFTLANLQVRFTTVATDVLLEECLLNNQGQWLGDREYWYWSVSNVQLRTRSCRLLLSLVSLSNMKLLHSLVILVCLSLQHLHLCQCKSQKLLLLLLDGVRWDYLNYDGLGQDGFRRVIREGVKAEYLQCDFPTRSTTNYYSIMTGMCCIYMYNQISILISNSNCWCWYSVWSA